MQLNLYKADNKIKTSLAAMIALLITNCKYALTFSIKYITRC